jgi:hypothetical protein
MENLIVAKNEMVGIFKKDFCIQGHTSKEVLEILERNEQISSKEFHREMENLVIRSAAFIVVFGVTSWIFSKRIRKNNNEDQE